MGHVRSPVDSLVSLGQIDERMFRYPVDQAFDGIENGTIPNGQTELCVGEVHLQLAVLDARAGCHDCEA